MVFLRCVGLLHIRFYLRSGHDGAAKVARTIGARSRSCVLQWSAVPRHNQ